MTKFNTALLASGAQSFGISLTPSQLQSFEVYAELLEDWNSKLNLTSVPPEDTVTLHFLDSLSIAQIIRPHGTLLDVGTGAGFPGVPLKIAFPEIQLTVVDSIAKKLGFIEALARKLDLAIGIVCARAEVLAHDAARREHFDFVVSRAVADLEPLSAWMLPFLRIGGTAIAMKSKEAESELESARRCIGELGGAEARIVEVTIPTSPVLRKLVIIKKLHSTPPSFPKRGNVKKKR